MKVVFLGLFFVSGAAAVLYQVIWQRLLTFTTGADVHSVSIIVAAFMAGLGLGSLLGGAIADRLNARRRLLAFAACELGIALFAVLSAPFLYDVLYVRLGEANLPRAALGAIGFVVLLWPTVLMGMSLPLAARILTADIRRPDEWVPVLYGWNTLGAAAGAVLAVTVLFRSFDFTESLLIGAAMNATFGIVAAVLAGREKVKAPEASSRGIVEHAAPARTTPSESAVIRTFGGWMALYVLSGFVALSLELVWFRVLGVVHKSTALTFGLLLGMYLAGLGAGSLAGHMAWARRLPAARSFLVMQAAIPIYAGLALAALVGIAGLPQAGLLAAHLGSYDARPAGGLFTPVYLFVIAGVPFLLMAPATFLMGLSFGSLQRAVQTDLDGLGRRVGWLQAANILGAVVGTLLTGFVLLDRVGTSGTMRLLVAMSIVFLWLLSRSPVRDQRHAWVRQLVPLSLLVAALVAIPNGAHLWAKLHGAHESASVHAEDSTGLTLLKKVTDRSTVVFSNGLGQSQLPYGGIHTALGALPALAHPAPHEIAVIGLGSGNTAFAVAGRPETRAIHTIEIVSANLAALRAWAHTRTPPGLVQLLQDPRVLFHLTDGRAFLLRSSARYDIIEADALRASSAYSGNLYSVEYFQLLRSRLKPGGFAVTWVATRRTRHSLVAAFPHVLVAGPIGFGSETPIPFDASSILARLDHPFTSAHYAAAGLDMRRELESMLSAPPTIFGPEFDRTTLTDLNRDLAPRDEFRHMWEKRVQ